MAAQFGRSLYFAAVVTIFFLSGTPANFNRFRVLALLLHRRRSMEVNQIFHDFWPSPRLVHIIHFRGFLPRNRILPCAKFTLRPSFAFHIGNVTARHSSSGRQPNFASFRRGVTNFGRAATTLGIGPNSSSFFFLFLVLTYSQRSQIGCLPHFHTCGLSANLE